MVAAGTQALTLALPFWAIAALCGLMILSELAAIAGEHMLSLIHIYPAA